MSLPFVGHNNLQPLTETQFSSTRTFGYVSLILQWIRQETSKLLVKAVFSSVVQPWHVLRAPAHEIIFLPILRVFCAAGSQRRVHENTP